MVNDRSWTVSAIETRLLASEGNWSTDYADYADSNPLNPRNLRLILVFNREEIFESG